MSVTEDEIKPLTNLRVLYSESYRISDELVESLPKLTLLGRLRIPNTPKKFDTLIENLYHPLTFWNHYNQNKK